MRRESGDVRPPAAKRRAIIAENLPRAALPAPRHSPPTPRQPLARPARRHRGRRRLLRYLLPALLAADLLGTMLYLAWGALSLPPPTPQLPHPVGVVFFDGFGAREGLGAGSLARVEHAAALARAGLLEQLVCVGGSRSQRAEPGAALMAAALIRRGIPAAHVRHDASSFDTGSNWQSALALMPRTAAEQALLISGPLHLLRIRHITGGVGTPAPVHGMGQEIRRRGPAIWLDVHREWVAWAAPAVLPAAVHRRWIKRWRDFWDNPASHPSAPATPRDA